MRHPASPKYSNKIEGTRPNQTNSYSAYGQPDLNAIRSLSSKNRQAQPPLSTTIKPDRKEGKLSYPQLQKQRPVQPQQQPLRTDQGQAPQQPRAQQSDPRA